MKVHGVNIDPEMATLAGEDLLSGLSPRDVKELERPWTDEEYEDAYLTHYLRRPPTMREFIEDPYWMGSVLSKSEDSEGLFPTWKEILIRDFDLDSKIHNLVVTGSLGIGKTYIMVAIILYRIACTTLLKNPQAFFGLGRGSKIIYNFLSVTKQVVTETAFGDAMNFMTNSPYFREECGFDPDLKYSNFRIPLRNQVYLTAGSKGWHVLGRNVIGVGLDEGNWRTEANPDTQAYELYNEVRTRIANRFQKMAGFLPAISVVASSAKDESSFTEQIIGEIDKANDPSQQRVYRNAIYKIKRHTIQLKERWFKVAHGLKNMEPMLLEGWYHEDGTPIEVEGVEHEETPKGASVELVPENYHQEFKRNTRVSLQSIAGISTGGSNLFFPSIIDIERCIEFAELDGVVDPMKGGHQMIPISMEDDMNIWDYLDHKKFLTRQQSKILPARHPYSLRYAHLDLATKNMAGLAVCHLVGRKLVEGLLDRTTGGVFSEYRLIVEYDFILTITAGRVKPISLEKIQNFFFWLLERCGYRFGKVTADQFQSEMPLQMMEARGFNVDKFSLDRNKEGYNSWKTAFEELRLRPYRQLQMVEEAEKLLNGEKKIDHPKDGSKDTTDAAAGAYHNAINSDEKVTMLVEDHPGIHSDNRWKALEGGPPPVDVPLPLGYDKVSRFKG